jgi:hypothetical protein
MSSQTSPSPTAAQTHQSLRLPTTILAIARPHYLFANSTRAFICFVTKVTSDPGRTAVALP